MTSKLISQILKYGNWSGPGYTAGKFVFDYRNAGLSRILTPRDFALGGVDAYDQFVAKPHDLNEFVAETQLRDVLASVGLIDNTQVALSNGEVVYQNRLVYGQDIGGDFRFVSQDYYLNVMDSALYTDAQRFVVGQAFFKYNSHIARSNAQFTVDSQANRPSVWTTGGSALGMELQLAGAPHLFLTENIGLSELNGQLFSLFGEDFVSDVELAQYYDQNFVTPDLSETALNGRGFTPTLTPDLMKSLSFEELLQVYVERRDLYMDYHPEQARLYREMEQRGGFKNYEEFMEAVVEAEDRLAGKCFSAGTKISMWDGTEKPIEEIAIGDWVTSYDENGRLAPGRVSKTKRSNVRFVLDVFGLRVTPGHATLCGDGQFDGRHVPMIDILRSDGALVKTDGSKVRAGTGCELGSKGDQMIWAVAGEVQPNGSVKVRDRGQIRLGTRFITDDGHDLSVEELIAAAGGMVTQNGLIVRGADGSPRPFHWAFTPMLPKPEDYVLQRSAIDLQDIYRAAEWEAARPRTPFPN